MKIICTENYEKIESKSKSKLQGLQIRIEVGSKKKATAWSVLIVHEYASTKNNR